MRTYVYRSSRKPDTYIYLSEKDDFSKVPKDISISLGTLEFSMELELSTDMKLVKENPGTVMENINNKGFHIQLPDTTTIEELLTKTSE
jgi:uncharacterized protein YcgL (UPF0745 family)